MLSGPAKAMESKERSVSIEESCIGCVEHFCAIRVKAYFYLFFFVKDCPTFIPSSLVCVVYRSLSCTSVFPDVWVWSIQQGYKVFALGIAVSQENDMELVLLYYKIPFWRAEVARLALHLGDIPFEDRHLNREAFRTLRAQD